MNAFEIRKLKDVPKHELKGINRHINISRSVPQPRQIKAVIYVKENGKITNQEYQVICETSNRTATRGLTELVSLKIFQQIGTTGKGTKYVLRRHKNAIKTP